jgi:hypothetical protein
MDNLKNQDSPATCDIKVDGTSLKDYRLQDFQDAWERYAGPGRHQSRARKLGRDQLTPLN